MADKKENSSQPEPAQQRGAFIVFEGPDGGGKTTHARLLAAALSAAGRQVLLTREPGGTPLGEAVRGVLLSLRRGARADDGGERTALAELFLFMAARAELAAKVLRPALAAGKVVIADRFLLSSLVYQGLAGELGVEPVAAVGRLATGGLVPDLTLVLDVPAAVGLGRSRARSGAADRIESRGPAYHERVRRGFRRLAGGGGGLKRSILGRRVVLLDTRRPQEQVRARVLAEVRDVLG